MAEPTLKPCPRCEIAAAPIQTSGNAGPLHGVACADPACAIHSPWFGTKEEAAGWWNERPAQHAEPTRNAAAPPHQCPYGGHGVNYHWAGDDHYPGDSANRHKEYDQQCGRDGWLCDRCKEDRADRRTRALVYGLALVRSGRGDGNLPGCAEAEFILKQEGLL